MNKKIIQISILVFCFNFSDAQTKTNNQGIMSIQGVTGTISEMNNTTSGVLTNDGSFYLYNHYHNDGIVTFTNGLTTGTTFMNGITGFQNISGTSLMRWFNCEFDNPTSQPAFRLSNQISISGLADFFQGIVDDDNFGGLAIFEDNATHVNVDDDSHVDGFVRKNGNEYFRFPIGDSQQYRYAAISAPLNIADAFSGKYFLENSNALYPHINKQPLISLIDNTEYWIVEKTASSSNVFLTLTWDTDTTPPLIYSTPFDEIHIVRWDAIQNIWVDEGGVADVLAKEVTTIINPLTQYGVFTLARVRNELPCSNLIFNNYISNNGDTDNAFFNIENIEDCPNNKVEIYNRWGIKVFETNSYNTNGNVFTGRSSARLTNNIDSNLPDGTYFYIIEFKDFTSGELIKKSGYVFLN